MQDNAPDYRAKATRLELDRRDVKKIFWPFYSSDLNPIEHVWDLIKDWIQEQYPKYEKGKISYKLLRKIVQEAWDSIFVD